MITESAMFLLLLLIISIVAKNHSLLLAIIVLFLLKIFGVDAKVFSFIQTKGINWGVTMITIALLAPIASGAIGFRDLGEAFRSPYAWIACISCIAVALMGKRRYHSSIGRPTYYDRSSIRDDSRSRSI